MFVRKKKNKSGSISIQIIDKSNGYKIFQTIGSSREPDEIERLLQKARLVVCETQKNAQQLKLLSIKTKEDLAVENFLESLSNRQIQTIGPELIFGVLFDRIGFNAIPDNLFRHITIARLAYPTSKLKTADYLYRYRGITISVDKIYQFLDKLSNTYKEQVEAIAYEYTKKTLKQISVVFYDMTTLYFESEDEDDLRRIGFSKDGKFNKPQIMIGLLVGQHGYPIGYDIFPGNTFEGHTLLPVLKNIQKKYSFKKKPIVIADAALLSKKNLENLAEQKYQFIIGGRIKNESDKIKKKIFKKARSLEEGQGFSLKKSDGTRLIVTYSDKRQKKDAYNRERGVRKLRQRIKSGRLTKESVNNRGYNKFLILKGKVKVKIDENKIKEDQKWDGLKGYITNTKLSPKQATENYKHLWQIEKAFRISKTDLRVRPIYHYRQRRIEAHICIAFVAYTVYKELERLLDKHKIGFSPKRASELTHNMYQLSFTLPHYKREGKIILKMNEEQRALYDLIHK